MKGLELTEIYRLVVSNESYEGPLQSFTTPELSATDALGKEVDGGAARVPMSVVELLRHGVGNGPR